MGCGPTKDVDIVADNKNKIIGESIREDKKKKDSEIRLLLLGAGESGKSTIAKQMKILHMGGYTTEEKETYILSIHSNIHESMQALIEACQDLEIPIETDAAKDASEKYREQFNHRIPESETENIKAIWNDPGIQTAFKRQNEFQLNDSTQYFIQDIERVLSKDYVPTEQDILRLRIQTTGIIETTFDVEGKTFVIVDVGGQRSERKKWIHCFEGVMGVLFCVGISEFDKVLYEDNSTNRMHEALKLFQEICVSKWFTNSTIILFLNKEDILRQKLKEGKNISEAFSDYKGPAEFEPTVKFLKDKFENIKDVNGGKREIFSHVTNATNTKNVEVVFDALRENLLNKGLEGLSYIV